MTWEEPPMVRIERTDLANEELRAAWAAWLKHRDADMAAWLEDQRQEPSE